MVPESKLEKTEHGLVPKGEGWFVLNMRDAEWRHVDGRGAVCAVADDFEGWRRKSEQLGSTRSCSMPGEPMGMYHWEADQEDFLVVSGEAVLVIEGEERQLRAWDFVHCPPNTKHVIVGAGSGPCLVIAVGTRQHGSDSIGFPADEVAKRHGASVEEDTTDGDVAYASVPPPRADRVPRRLASRVAVAPRSVRLTSPERVLFPDEGITKQDLFEYYRAIAPVLVPHLRNRPFTMKRSPYGVGGDAYFQKQAPKGMPSWIPTRTYRTYPRGRKGESRMVDFPLVNTPEAVLWMVQMNCIDMNAWYSRVDKPDRPDFVLFDLDPPDGGFALAIRVAHLIREELERLELESYVKTSGADGIHVLVPIARRATYEQTYEFAERVARGLEERHPGLVTTEWLKHKREGVLVDHRQNARGKTIASVYSVRPKPGAPVSTPLRWDELTEDVTPRRFGMREALERVEQHGDLFEPVLAGGQALGRALKKLR